MIFRHNKTLFPTLAGITARPLDKGGMDVVYSHSFNFYLY